MRSKLKVKKFKFIIKKISNTQTKYIIVYTLISFVFAYIVSGLLELQLIDGRKNLLAATRTSQSQSLVLPHRGIIYDTNGEILAYNVPTYSVYVEKNKIATENERDVFQKISKVLDTDIEELLRIYRDLAYSQDDEVKIKIATNLNTDKYYSMIETVVDIDGVVVERDTQRRYKDSNYFSNILGYIGKPTKDEIKGDVYSISFVGKTGIEKVYDENLRGKSGKEITQLQYLEGRESTFVQEQAIDGENIYLTIDAKWQKKLTEIMQESLKELDAFASAAVIMNSDTGEVMSMVTNPSYNNNLFAEEIKTEQYRNLLNDPKRPLMNRPIALQLPSGSVFKIIASVAALDKGAITSNTIINSEGCMQLSAGIEFCEADKKVLGNLNVASALSKSSNLFFCKTAMRMNSTADGIYTINDYAKKMGLGKKTGIDLIGEQEGTLASPELKYKLFQERWYVGDDCNSIIGQGLVTVTPLQMTVATSSINNGGKIIRPKLVSKMETQSGRITKQFTPEVLDELNVSQSTLNRVKEGMRMAASEGSGSQLTDIPGDNIIKTGSADASELIDGKLYSGAHSWITGCFKFQDKNYCYTIMQQWAGRGFRTIPIAKKFINCVHSDFSAGCEKIN